MPRNQEKNYSIGGSVRVPVNIETYRTAPWVQTYVTRSFDFRRWLYIGRPELTDDGGKISSRIEADKPLKHAGRDGLVEAIREAVWHMPAKEQKTKLNYCLVGLTYWFEYLDYRDAAGEPICELVDIDGDAIKGFIQWLRFTKEANTQTGQLSYTSAKGVYSKLKAVLQFLVRQRGLPEGLFQKNPFPNCNRSYVSHKPYTKKVMTALMSSLYLDIKALRAGALELNGSDVLALYLLAIAARTGRNATPLLEMTRDAVFPHPIKPEKFGLLVTYKRRGRNTSVQAFEKGTQIEDMVSLPMDALTLYNEVLAMTAPLVADATPRDQNRLWLYRKADGSYEITTLGVQTFFDVVQKIVQRHGLTDDGKPLRLNVSRLRKTFAQRIWQLTGGDLIATAESLGNTPAVAGQSYIGATPDMSANFRRLVMLMHADWAGKLDDIVLLEKLAKETGISPNVLRDIAVGYNNTGVGRCTDPQNGAMAPGNGSLCTRWLECFRCPNQLVMETDLYRLFSFYFLLRKECNFISREKWNAHYLPIIEIIDNEIIAQNLRTKDNPKGCFDPYRVNKAKAEAEANPHRMWQDRTMLMGVL